MFQFSIICKTPFHLLKPCTYGMQNQQLEEFEDTKGVIRVRISKKNRKHNCQKKKVQKDKQRSTKHTYRTKARVT